MRFGSVLTICLVAPAVLHAAAPPPAGVVVDLAAEDPGRAWLATALEKRIEHELTRFNKVRVLVPPRDAAEGCAEVGCRLRAHGGLGADFVMVGTLDEVRLAYVTYAVATGASVDSGSLYVGPGATPGRVESDISASVRPLVGSGGLIERLMAQAAAVEPVVAGPERRLPVAAVFALLLLLLAIPLIAIRRMMTSKQLRAALRPRSLRFSSFGIAALSIGLVVQALPHTTGLSARLSALVAPLPSLVALVPVAGGVLWGALLLLVLRHLVPVLHGIERIGHEALVPLLRAFVVVALVRVGVLAAVTFPVVLGLRAGAALFGFSPDVTSLIVIPAAGLVLYYLYLSLVDHLALLVDHLHVDGVVSEANAWHRVVKRYLVGYAQRLRLELDRDTLARVLFLPGKGEDTVTYGGGLARPRIVIPHSLLEMALGPLPAEIEKPERRIDWDELAAGLLVPRLETGRKKAAAEGRVVAPRPAAARGYAPRLLGEHTTALGYILPQQDGETVPLLSNDSEDFAVVRQLLTEHYAAFQRREGDDEYAGAEITHKDFLFGLLLRELGIVQRHESMSATVWIAAQTWVLGATRLTRAAFRAAADLAARFFSRYPATIADSFAALSSGKDHLIQYLHYQRTWREADLTARGDAPRLLAASHEILRATRKEAPEGLDVQRFRATLRNRLVWLSRYYYAPLEEPRTRWLSWLGAGAVAVALAAVLGRLVGEAIEYHPVYTFRIERQEAQLRAALEEESVDGREHQ